MIDLLSTRERQYFDIVKLIFNHEKRKKDICKELAITANTLEVIVDDFNHVFSPMSLKSKKSSISINIPDYLSYDFFISRLLNSSLEYQVLEYIFFNDCYSYEELSDRLFISKSTLIRTIKNINLVIKSYEFSIETKPLRIIGNERNIRFFFITFFKDKYGLSNLPFSKEEIERIRSFYLMGTKIANISTSIQDQNNFLLFSLVALKRESMGYTKDKTDLSRNMDFLVNTIQLLEKVPFFSKISNKHFLDKNFVSKVFSLFLQDGFLKTNFYSHRKQVALFDQSNISLFIERVETEFNIVIGKEDKFLLSQKLYEIIFGYLSFPSEFTFLDDTYSNFYDYHSFPVDNLKRKFKEIYHACFSDDKHPYFSFVLFTTYTQWPSFLEQLYKNNPIIKIVIYIDFDPAFGNYIKSRIATSLNGNYSIIVRMDITDNFIPIDTDLLITNVFSDIQFPHNKTICISHFITDKDIHDIFMKIKNLENKEIDKKYSKLHDVENIFTE